MTTENGDRRPDRGQLSRTELRKRIAALEEKIANLDRSFARNWSKLCRCVNATRKLMKQARNAENQRVKLAACLKRMNRKEEPQHAPEGGNSGQ